MYDAARGKEIDRTKTGLLLLLVAGLISWIPLIVIRIIGGLLALVGLILLVLGRKAFGATHSRNVVIAITSVLAGFIIAFVAGFPFGSAVYWASYSVNPTAYAPAVADGLAFLLLGAVIAVTTTGIGSVLFSYALQERRGKALLWVGYATNLAVQIAIIAIITPLIPDAVAQAFSSGRYNSAPILALQSEIVTYGLLDGISGFLYAAATYLAWSRLDRGEIPTFAIRKKFRVPPKGMPPRGPAPPINPQ